MWCVNGRAKRCCDGIPRRDFLHVGGMGLAGLSLGDLLRAEDDRNRRQRETRLLEEKAGFQSKAGLGRAKSLIVLFLYGAPSQMDTFDPKPLAPVESRGDFGTIETSVPGVRICEHLPRIAQCMDRVTLIRSL